MLSLLAAVEAGQKAGTGEAISRLQATRPGALALVGPGKARAVTKARPGGSLGCRVKPELFERFARQGRIGPQRAGPPSGLERQPLPPAVRLHDLLDGVKDQGRRGTCVAFASVALKEFLHGTPALFSEQFLYWACKELDGYDGSGTYLHTGMNVLGLYGVCRSNTWPYNPEPIEHNESQKPPPPGAIEEARGYRVIDCRMVEPSLVEQYKRVLAGDDQVSGMPVVFGVLVFDSWFMSAETHRTGKITLPLPGETPIGGHAMCVVGYVDDVEVPGGGYFIVRNSWGNEWAPESPEAAGHALVPYAYVESYALEAFTGPAIRVSGAPTNGDAAFRRYLRKLPDKSPDSERRDIEKRLLPPGKTVLCHPLAPQEFMEDTEGNRQRFKEADFTWTSATRQRVWFPNMQLIPADLKARLDAAAVLKQRFSSTLDENLISAAGTPFPQVRVPGWFKWLPYEWEPKIKGVSVLADLTDLFVDRMRTEIGCVPREVPLPAESRQRLSEFNVMKVYAVEGFALTAHVVVAFVNALRFQPETMPQWVGFDQRLTFLVQTLYAEWLRDRRQARPPFTFFTIGTADPLPEGTMPVASSDHWIVFSSCSGPKQPWESRIPPRIPDRKSLRDFSDRLLPESRRDRVARIKTIVDDLLATDGGNVTVDKVVKRSRLFVKPSGYRRASVRDGFLCLQDQGPDDYRLRRTQEGLIAIARPNKGEPITITAASFQRRFLRRHALRILSSAVGVSVSMSSVPLKSWFEQKVGLPGYCITAVGILIAYFGSLIQSAINRRADQDKEE
ncbi:MAG: C1 family peptidase [Verrucomicrobia bacterium]|nr:C1 family peptidase [Verrucomicrobiota bacterium]